METLLVGMLIVVASAVGFGLALFGRRPVPQPATDTGRAHLGPVEPEKAARPPTTATAASGGSSAPGRGIALRPRPHRAPDVTLSAWTRIRSALLLALTVVGLATLIGGVLSVVVVGLVLLAT